MATQSDLLSGLPRVDRVLDEPRVHAVRAELGDARARDLVREVLEGFRRALIQGDAVAAPSVAEVSAAVEARAVALGVARSRAVINATGVLLHTNLGRAPMTDGVARAVFEAAKAYVAVEIDLATGERGRRGGDVEDALVRLTGAEAALVVNNGAAAVLLMLAAVAARRPVIVSRGELVEIGGGFRIPDVLAESGSRLIEVGTTNKTRRADYERALDEAPDAGAILRVHRSNFRMTGFVEEASTAELARLAREREVPFLHDLGGGALGDVGVPGLEGEPTVAQVLADGASLVCFSTDKLVGGPQGGAIVGARSLVERARRHPLARALRLGKLPMAALQATLEDTLRGEAPLFLRQARVPAAALSEEVTSWGRAIEARVPSSRFRVTCRPSRAEIGGGTFAARTFPSFALVIEGRGVVALAARLRAGTPSVLGRLEGGALWLDARAVLPGDVAPLIERLVAELALSPG